MKDMGGDEIDVEKPGPQTCIYLGAHHVCKLNLEQSYVDFKCPWISIFIKKNDTLSVSYIFRLGWKAL